LSRWTQAEFSLIEFFSDSPQDTFSLGRRIASCLRAGSTVALEGELGSGKTHLVKGIADGLGVTETVTSPTYTIINEYKSSPVLYHIDAYRLLNDEDFENSGGVEIINSGGVSLIEWGGRIPKSLPPDAIIIIIKITGPCSRLIQINGLDAI